MYYRDTAGAIRAGVMLVLVYAVPCSAGNETAVDATAWVTRGDHYMRGESQDMRLTFQVITPRWERMYELRSWMQGTDKTFVRVLGPPRSKGRGYLKLASRLWQYIPTAEQTVLIPPSMMLEDFLGSDFTNDDFVKQSSLPRDYTHRLIAEETLDGTPTYLIELLPKPEAPVVYGKLRLWLRQSDAAFVKLEFYNEQMVHLRTLFYTDFRRFNDRGYPARWQMVNHLEPGHETTVTIQTVVFNLPIDPDLFTRGHLERAE